MEPSGSTSLDVPEPGPRLVGAERVLAVLKELAEHPDGVSLDELSRSVLSPKPTVHRALVSLRKTGFASQDSRGHYLLGDEFLALAFAHHEARPDHRRVVARLEALAVRFGETTHYAVLDDHSVVYRSKVDPPTGAIKLASTVGGRQPAHSTAVGKMLLSYALPDQAAVQAWVGELALPRFTDRTLTTAAQLHGELTRIRAQGYSIDNQENEPGVNCLALPVFLTSPSRPSGAISISGLVYRTPVESLLVDLETVRAIISTPDPTH
jgi:IclR family acetate operon transcriptional repressor